MRCVAHDALAGCPPAPKLIMAPWNRVKKMRVTMATKFANELLWRMTVEMVMHTRAVTQLKSRRMRRKCRKRAGFHCRPHIK